MRKFISNAVGKFVTSPKKSDSASVMRQVNDAPVTNDSALRIKKDSFYTFSQKDFVFSDANSKDTLSKIRITGLPVKTCTLQLFNGKTWVNIKSNTDISISQINSGSFRIKLPANVADGNEFKFSYKVNDGQVFSDKSATLTLAIGNTAATISGDASGNLLEDNLTARISLPATLSNLIRYINMSQTAADSGAELNPSTPVTPTPKSAVVWISTEGKLNVFDPNAGEGYFKAKSTLFLLDINGSSATFMPADFQQIMVKMPNAIYGHFTLNEDGSWKIILNNQSIDFLRSKDVINFNVPIESADGTTKDIKITLQGHDDKPVAISSEHSFDVMLASSVDPRQPEFSVHKLSDFLQVMSPDRGTSPAVIILNAESSQGKWQYRTSDADQWKNLEATEKNALVLHLTDQVRFVPNLDFDQSVDVNLICRGWAVDNSSMVGTYESRIDATDSSLDSRLSRGTSPIAIKAKINFTPDQIAVNEATMSGSDPGAQSSPVLLSTTSQLSTSGKLLQGDYTSIVNQMGKYGSFSLRADGSWHYDLSPDAPLYQKLAPGEKTNEFLTVMSTDGKIQYLKVGVEGIDEGTRITTNFISNDDTVGHEAGIMVKGSIKVLDPDLADSQRIATQSAMDRFGFDGKPDGKFGSFDFFSTTGGDTNFLYFLDKSNPNFQNLFLGQVAHELVTVRAPDGTQSALDIKVVGENSNLDLQTVMAGSNRTFTLADFHLDNSLGNSNAGVQFNWSNNLPQGVSLERSADGIHWQSLQSGDKVSPEDIANGYLRLMIENEVGPQVLKAISFVASDGSYITQPISLSVSITEYVAPPAPPSPEVIPPTETPPIDNPAVSGGGASDTGGGTTSTIPTDNPPVSGDGTSNTGGGTTSTTPTDNPPVSGDGTSNTDGGTTSTTPTDNPPVSGDGTSNTGGGTTSTTPTDNPPVSGGGPSSTGGVSTSVVNLAPSLEGSLSALSLISGNPKALFNPQNLLSNESDLFSSGKVAISIANPQAQPLKIAFGFDSSQSAVHLVDNNIQLNGETVAKLLQWEGCGVNSDNSLTPSVATNMLLQFESNVTTAKASQVLQALTITDYALTGAVTPAINVMLTDQEGASSYYSLGVTARENPNKISGFAQNQSIISNDSQVITTLFGNLTTTFNDLKQFGKIVIQEKDLYKEGADFYTVTDTNPNVRYVSFKADSGITYQKESVSAGIATYKIAVGGSPVATMQATEYYEQSRASAKDPMTTVLKGFLTPSGVTIHFNDNVSAEDISSVLTSMNYNTLMRGQVFQAGLTIQLFDKHMQSTDINSKLTFVSKNNLNVYNSFSEINNDGSFIKLLPKDLGYNTTSSTAMKSIQINLTDESQGSLWLTGLKKGTLVPAADYDQSTWVKITASQVISYNDFYLGRVIFKPSPSYSSDTPVTIGYTATGQDKVTGVLSTVENAWYITLKIPPTGTEIDSKLTFSMDGLNTLDTSAITVGSEMVYFNQNQEHVLSQGDLLKTFAINGNKVFELSGVMTQTELTPLIKVADITISGNWSTKLIFQDNETSPLVTYENTVTFQDGGKFVGQIALVQQGVIHLDADNTEKFTFDKNFYKQADFLALQPSDNNYIVSDQSVSLKMLGDNGNLDLGQLNLTSLQHLDHIDLGTGEHTNNSLDLKLSDLVQIMKPGGIFHIEGDAGDKLTLHTENKYTLMQTGDDETGYTAYHVTDNNQNSFDLLIKQPIVTTFAE